MDDTRTTVSINQNIPVDQCYSLRRDVFETTWYYDGSVTLWDDVYVFNAGYFFDVAIEEFDVQIPCSETESASGNLRQWAGYTLPTTVSACCDIPGTFDPSTGESCCGCSVND